MSLRNLFPHRRSELVVWHFIGQISCGPPPNIMCYNAVKTHRSLKLTTLLLAVPESQLWQLVQEVLRASAW